MECRSGKWHATQPTTSLAGRLPRSGRVLYTGPCGSLRTLFWSGRRRLRLRLQARQRRNQGIQLQTEPARHCGRVYSCSVDWLADFGGNFRGHVSNGSGLEESSRKTDQRNAPAHRPPRLTDNSLLGGRASLDLSRLFSCRRKPLTFYRIAPGMDREWHQARLDPLPGSCIRTPRSMY